MPLACTVETHVSPLECEMCDRFTLTQPAAIAARFELDNFAPPEREFYTPRFNVAPTQRIVVIPTSEGQRVARRRRWGLIRGGLRTRRLTPA
jgi:putative SOS response-associated peptidase YedK